MNKLREELNALIRGTETVRPPALRRSLREDSLYATDLPRAAESEEAVSVFRRCAENAGWQTKEEAGWIQMDLPEAVPADTGFAGPYGTEAKACAGLLRRHREHRRPGGRERRILIKAGEESAEAFEKACAALHREWAAALRRREALPDLPESIFTGGQDL